MPRLAIDAMVEVEVEGHPSAVIHGMGDHVVIQFDSLAAARVWMRTSRGHVGPKGPPWPQWVERGLEHTGWWLEARVGSVVMMRLGSGIETSWLARLLGWGSGEVRLPGLLGAWWRGSGQTAA